MSSASVVEIVVPAKDFSGEGAGPFVLSTAAARNQAALPFNDFSDRAESGTSRLIVLDGSTVLLTSGNDGVARVNL